MMTHDISWNTIEDAYRTQMYIHNLLAEEYAKEGMEYGGRTLYSYYDKGSMHYDKGLGNVLNTKGIGFIPNSNGQIGYNGNYSRLVPEIHRRVLERLYNGAIRPTNKHISEKFSKLSINDGLDVCIKATDELIYDIKTVHDWAKMAKEILDKAKKDVSRKIIDNDKNGNSQFRLTKVELLNIGQTILGKAISICPIETGFLRSSGRVISYDNSIRILFECPYAVYVHENPNAIHPIGEYKFLEKAAQEVLSDVSVWTETTGDNFVEGKYMQLKWLDGRSSPPTWVEQHGYNAVYIDIDRNLNVNYVH